MAWLKLSLLLLSGALASPLAPPAPIPPKRPLQWGSIGDSWTSGVAFTDDMAYDGNKDNCLRIKDAWSSQMSDDKSWLTDGGNFQFKGCSGAVLGSMSAPPPPDHPDQKTQLRQMDHPELVFMQAGGNNARFGEAVDKCIYHSGVFGYGAPYHLDKDGTGACKMILGNISDYIHAEGQYKSELHSLEFDLRATLDDAFNYMAEQGSSKFTLYLVGYGHFFSLETHDCDTWSFAPRYVVVDKPTLDWNLRERMNSLLTDMLTLYQHVVDTYDWPPSTKGRDFALRFADVTPGFDGHRFCEKNHAFTDQWSSDDVWLWNIALSDKLFPPSDGSGDKVTGTPKKDANGTLYLDDPADVAPQVWMTGSGSGNSGSGGGNEIHNGWLLKPFHPKKGGHGAIADNLIRRVKSDGLVHGVAAPPQPTNVPKPGAPQPQPQPLPAPGIGCGGVFGGLHPRCIGKRVVEWVGSS